MFRSFLPVLFLAACTSVDPITLLKLSTLSPLEADPSDIAVNVQLPDGLQIRPETAILSVSATRNDLKSEGMYVLATADGSDGTTYSVAIDDRARLKAQQALILGWKEEEPDTSGSISVGLEGCSVGTGPATNATISIQIRTEAQGPYLPLLNAMPIADVLDANELQPCS